MNKIQNNFRRPFLVILLWRLRCCQSRLHSLSLRLLKSRLHNNHKGASPSNRARSKSVSTRTCTCLNQPWTKTTRHTINQPSPRWASSLSLVTPVPYASLPVETVWQKSTEAKEFENSEQKKVKCAKIDIKQSLKWTNTNAIKSTSIVAAPTVNPDTRTCPTSATFGA